MKWQATCPGCSSAVQLELRPPTRENPGGVLAESKSCTCGEYDLDVTEPGMLDPRAGLARAPQAQWVNVYGVPEPAKLAEVA